MKRVLFVIGFLIACTGVNYAQTTTAKKEIAKTPASSKKNQAPAGDTTKRWKKDGADKKLKGHAAAGDTTKHWKKDGAADKKWKGNAAAGDTAKHWKKDGGADKKGKGHA